jgi:hypothetical protein
MKITQERLGQLVKLEGQIEKAKRALKSLLDQHEEWDAPITAALLEGTAKIEPGALTASIDWTERRSPNYKAWIDAEHGEGTAERILKATPPTRTPHLIVEEVAG